MTWRLLAMLGTVAALATGCGGGGSPVSPQPTEVDYTAFTDTLTVGELTGALVAELLRAGLPAGNVSARLALPGESAEDGYRTQSDARGLLRIGNIPGGTYDLYLSAPGTVSRVVEVTITARVITSARYELQTTP